MYMYLEIQLVTGHEFALTVTGMVTGTEIL